MIEPELSIGGPLSIAGVSLFPSPLESLVWVEVSPFPFPLETLFWVDVSPLAIGLQTFF